MENTTYLKFANFYNFVDKYLICAINLFNSLYIDLHNLNNNLSFYKKYHTWIIR